MDLNVLLHIMLASKKIHKDSPMKKFSYLIFSITFLFVFLPSISALCQVGTVNFSAGTFCTLDGTFAPLRIDQEICTNDYECLNQSCIDGVCQVRYSGFGERGIWMQRILDYLNGIECDPRDQTLICQNGRGYVCGANAVYEDKGTIPPCTNSSNPDDGNNGGGGGGGGGINLLIISPRNITYNTAIISLEAVDRSRQAKYFSYALDDGNDVVFSSPTSLSVSLGSHTLEVTAKRSASSSSKSTRSVTFTVLEEGASSCGDGICSSDEIFACPVDCGQQIDPFCNNNGICDNLDLESSQTCPNDCPAADRDSKWGELLLIIILLIIAISVVTFLIIRKYHLLSKDTTVTATAAPKVTTSPAGASPMTGSVSSIQKNQTVVSKSIDSSSNSSNPFSSEFGNI